MNRLRRWWDGLDPFDQAAWRERTAHVACAIGLVALVAIAFVLTSCAPLVHTEDHVQVDVRECVIIVYVPSQLDIDSYVRDHEPSL